MHFIPILLFVLLYLCPLFSYAERSTLFSMNTGSFLFHIVPLAENSNQYFGNQYFSIEKKFSKNSDYSLIVGTFINSQNDRCMLLGLRKDLYQVNNSLVIKGVYSYAGEFFFDAFDDCGNDDVYRKVKDKMGVGFMPYVYHGVQYNFNDHFAVEAGFLLPLIFAMSIQWSF